MRLLKILIILSFSFSTVLFAHSKKKKSLAAHEHGVGILNISQDGSILLFEFEAPGYDIVGFEYEAKEKNDIAKVDDALLVLSDYKNIVLPSSSAECELQDSSAKVINDGKHSEFLSYYKFNCQKISDLKIVYIKYFSKFKNCEKTNIKIFGQKKKSAYVIGKSKRLINVKGHF